MLIADEALPDLPVRAVLPQVLAALATPARRCWSRRPAPARPRSCRWPWPARRRPGRGRRAAPGRRPGRRPADGRAARRAGRPAGRLHRARRPPGVPGHRVEVVTTGVLVRRLQRDPELAGTAVVILDECHERHLDSDLALAFLVEVRAALRPDLRLLATSATADADRLAAVLGARARWSTADGPAVPGRGALVARRRARSPRRSGCGSTPGCSTTWPPPSGGRWPTGDGDVLVFLPGAGEIDAVAGRLRGVGADVVAAARPPVRRRPGRRAAPGPRRRVVLATAVAESSLTVPGVRAVVDAGLSRVPRMDHARGLGALVTVPVSPGAAAQRAGRAGREAPGRVYRCWSAGPARPAAGPARAGDRRRRPDRLRAGPGAVGPPRRRRPGPARPAAGRRAADRAGHAARPRRGRRGRPGHRARPRPGRRRPASAAGPRPARRRRRWWARAGPPRSSRCSPRTGRPATTWSPPGGGPAATDDPAWRAEVRRLTAAVDRAPATGPPRLDRGRPRTADGRDAGDAGRRTAGGGSACRTIWRPGWSSGWRTRSGWPGRASPAAGRT